jgi:hypothetical protein
VKKVFSILFALAIIFAGVHITVSMHYCGGKVAATGISLSGKLASCGMEGNEETCPMPGHNLTTHCCHDIVSVYSLDNNFAPSTFFIPDSYQNNFQILSITAGYPVHSITVLHSFSTNSRHPGAFQSTNVDLSDICIFRI